MSRPGTERGAAWLAMVAAGGAAVALASRSGGHAAVTRSLGWALLAAVGASVLLQAAGRRLVAVLALALSAGLAVVVALGEGHAGLWAAALLGLAGAGAQLVRAGRWQAPARHRRASPAGPATDLDVWKALDAGVDPTSDEFRDNLAPREDSPVVTTRKPGTASSGPDEEDQ